MGGVFSNICRNAGLSAAQELNEALNKAVGGLDNHAQERIDQINGLLSARIDQMNGVCSARIDQMNGVCSARITQVGDTFVDSATHLGERVEQAVARSVGLTERALGGAVSSCRALERDIARDASHLITNAVSSCRALERDASHLIDFAMAQIRWTLWFAMVYVLIVLYHVFVAPPLHFTVCSICITALMNARFSFQYRIVESERQVQPCLPPLPRNIAQLKAGGPSCTLMSQDFKGSAWVGSSQTALILRRRSAQAMSQARCDLRYFPTWGDIRTKHAYSLERFD